MYKLPIILRPTDGQLASVTHLEELNLISKTTDLGIRYCENLTVLKLISDLGIKYNLDSRLKDSYSKTTNPLSMIPRNFKDNIIVEGLAVLIKSEFYDKLKSLQISDQLAQLMVNESANVAINHSLYHTIDNSALTWSDFCDVLKELQYQLQNYYYSKCPDYFNQYFDYPEFDDHILLDEHTIEITVNRISIKLLSVLGEKVPNIHISDDGKLIMDLDDVDTTGFIMSVLLTAYDY